MGRLASQPVGGFRDFQFRRPTVPEKFIGDSRIKRRQPVNELGFDICPSQTPRHAQQKIPVAGAEFDDPAWRFTGKMFAQCRGHDLRMIHPGVEPPQIAPRTPRGGIFRRQHIQQFRQDNAFHDVKSKIRSSKQVLRRSFDFRISEFFRTSDFALRISFHSTSNSAPCDVNPAPNDAIHHRPPGALSASAACSTNKTDGLLMLPCSRNTASLQRTSWLDN